MGSRNSFLRKLSEVRKSHITFVETSDLTDNGTPSFSKVILKHKVINYIKDAYERWHNYAEYHNQNNKGDSSMILNEVIFDVLQKPVNSTADLLCSIDGRYTKLDFMVLKTIKEKSINN